MHTMPIYLIYLQFERACKFRSNKKLNIYIERNANEKKNRLCRPKIHIVNILFSYMRRFDASLIFFSFHTVNPEK